MNAHIHAHLMAQYAQDAVTTEEPWKLWEYRLGVTESQWWWALHEHPKWTTSVGYRRKTKTIRIGEFDVPEPLREAPKLGLPCFTPQVGCADHTAEFFWEGRAVDHLLLSRGLIHIMREAAILHAKALISFSEARA